MRSAALLLTLTLAAFSATAFETGQFAPLTNTRYGAVGGDAISLATDGVDPYLFFISGNSLRMARIGDGPAQPARVILEGVVQTPAVVWTGSHFFVAAARRYPMYGVAATIVDRNGAAVRPQWALLDRAHDVPQAAFNGRVILMIFGTTLMTLDSSGSVLAQSSLTVNYGWNTALASNGSGFAAAIHEGQRRTVYRFDADGTLQMPGTPTVLGGPQARAAIASDGRDYLLVVHDAATSSLKAVRMPAEGGSGEILTVQRSIPGWEVPNLAVTWRGDAYVVSYRERDAAEYRAFTVDRNGDALTGQELIASADPYSSASMVSLRGRSLMAWNTADARKIGLRELQANADSTALVSYSAFDQDLEATAASATGTLFVWAEDGTLRSGFRTNAGEWKSDQSLDIDLTNVLLASNGSEFLLVGRNATAWLAVRLSPLGKPLSEPVHLGNNNAVAFTAITWHRQRYLLVGAVSNGVVAYTVDPALAVTGPIRLQDGYGGGYVNVASDGTNAMVVWRRAPVNDTLVFARLGPQFQILDSTPQPITSAPFLSLGPYGAPLAWDGKHYLVGWRGYPEDSIHITHIDREGKRAGIDIELPVYGEGRSFAHTRDISILAAGGTVAVSWQDTSQTFQSTHFRLLRNGQVFLERSWDVPHPASRAQLVRLGNRIGFGLTVAQHDAPYHGAARVMLAIAEAAPRALPEPPWAPALTARTIDADSVKLTWTAPAGPIHGYRIESSIEGGPWKEIEHWFAANETTATVRLLWPGARVAFRMRALNDAGAGAYSNDAPAASPRRRAVR